MRTAGEPVRVARSERRFGELTFVTFALVDENGTVCPHKDRELSFTTHSGTRLVALCSGDSSSHEDFRGPKMRTFHGLLLGIIEGSPTGIQVVEKSH